MVRALAEIGEVLMKIRGLYGKLVLTIALLALVWPSAGCRKFRGYGYGGGCDDDCNEDDYSSFDFTAVFGSFDTGGWYGGDDATYVDDGGWYDPGYYDGGGYYDEYGFYGDGGGKVKRAGRRK